MAEEILLSVKVQGEQATGFFRALATGAQGATQAISGIGPAFAGVAQGIQALGQLEKAQQSAISAGVQELQILQQQIAVQQQAMAGALSLADATRKLAEAEIAAKTGSQQLATELVAARTLHQQNVEALQAEAAAQLALQNAQNSARNEIGDLQQKIAILKQVQAGTLSLADATTKMLTAEAAAKIGDQQLAAELVALNSEYQKTGQSIQQAVVAQQALQAARQSAVASATQELQALQQQIGVQQQVMGGTLSLADATRTLAEAEIIAKTGSQQLAAELVAARTLHQQNTAVIQAEAAAQQALQSAQVSAKAEIAELQQKAAIQKQVLAGTISLEQGTRRLAEAEILAKTGSLQLATQLAALRTQTERNATAMRQLSAAGVQARAVFQSLGSAAGALGFIGGLAGAALLTKQLVTDGLAVSQAYETSGIAIAALLQGTTNLVDAQGKIVDSSRSWQANLKESARLQDEIAKISASTLGTDQELIGVFRTVLAFSRGQTAELDDQLKLAQGITNAGKLQGLTGQHLEFEAKQILELETDQGQQLLGLLAISIEQARLWKQQGILVQELNQRLKIYNILADSVALTWEGLITSVETFRNLTTKEAFTETFVGLKEILKGMSEEFDRLRQQGGFAAALGADAAQLQDLGRSLADIMVSLELVVAGTVNAFLTLAAQFNATADGAQHAEQGLQSLAETFSGGLQRSAAEAARSIAELIEDLKLLVPLIGLAQGAAAGGLIGAVVGGAAGLGVVKAFSEEIDTAAKRLTTFADRVDASAKKTVEVNAEIAKFAKLATDASVSVDVHQLALSGLKEALEDAKKGHIGLTAENKKLVEALAATDTGFKRVGQAMIQDADLLKTQAKLVSDAAKEYSNLQLRMAEITGNVTLFHDTKEADILRRQTEEIRELRLKGITDVTEVNKKYALQLQALTLDTTNFAIKEEKRKTDETLAEIDSRLTAQRASSNSILSGLSDEIEHLKALEDQAKRAGASQAEMAQLFEAENQKQAAFSQVALRIGESELVLLQAKLGILEKTRASYQAQTNLLQGKDDRVSLANLRQLNDALKELTQKITGQKVEIQGAKDGIAKAQADIANREIQRGEAQVALTHLYLEEENKRTQLTQEQTQLRADIELQGVQQRIDAITNQRGIEESMLHLREAQGAGLEEIADREKSLTALSQRRAEEEIRTAEIELALQQAKLDLLNKTIASQQKEFGAKFTAGDIASANDLAQSIEKAKLEAGGLTLNVEKSKGALDNAKAAAVALGIDGAAATAKLRHELELSRAVLTTNDARNIFSDILDAGSFKKAGSLLQKESKDLSKRIFTDLLFGKKGSFDEPLISNVNGLFGTGDGGILGKIMGAGGKDSGTIWGVATTDATQKTLQEKFPLVTKQSTDAAKAVFMEQGKISGAVWGDNCLDGFQQSFGDGIAGLIKSFLPVINKLFSGSGGIFDNVTSGGSSTAAGASSGQQFGGGFFDAIKGLFGGGGSGLFDNVTSGSSSTAAGAASGSQFGGGFMGAVKGLFGGGSGGGGLMGLFGGGGGAGAKGASGAGSWFGLGMVGAQIGSDFSKGKYGAGAGGVVGGALGAYFSMGNPAMTAAAAQLGSMIGGIFDSIFGKEGRISKEKGKIIKYFEKVFDIDFKKITEKAAAKGLAEFSAASPAALALGAIFQDGLKKGDVQGSSTRFAAQLLGNLRKMGDGADEVKDKLLKLADAANFDLHESIVQINQFTKETGADALTLGNFQEELGEAKKNLKEYGDTSNLTAAQLTELAAAHGNTGSQIVTYTTLIGGAIDIGIKFNEFLNGQTIAQGLAAQSFLDAATAAGSTGEAMTALSEKVRGGTLSLEEAAIELNKIREAAGQAALSLDDLAIDPKKLEVMVAVLQAATEGLLNFQAAETDALAAGLGQKLDEQGAAARFDEFMNATLRVSVTKAMIGGLIDGLQVEALKPFFTALGAEFTNLVTRSINAEEFGRRIAALRTEFGPLIDAAKAGFVEVDKTIRDVLTSLGLWPDAVDKTTTATRDLAAEITTVKDKIKAIDDQLLAIARRKIHVEIDLAAKLESIGAITLLEKLDIESEGLQAEFDLLTKKLNAMGDAAGLSVEQLGEAISLVQQLAANVVAKFQAEKAAIEAALATEIAAIKARGEAIANAIRASFDAQRKALEARITSLEKEKDLIAKAFDARREALEKELQLAEEFQRVGESIQQTINQLVTSNVAPISPFAQLSFLQRQAASVRGQLETAKPEDVPKLMQELTSLLQQMAQLQTPNSRPSPEFQKLFNSILAELEALRAEALAKGGKVDTIQDELKQLDIDRNKALDSIDLQIANARAQLDALSAAEQAALAAAAAGIEAEIAAAQAKADAKIEELRVAAAAELKRLADIETDLLSRQETLLLSDREIQLAQLTQLEDLNITAADFLKILASDYKAKPEQTPSAAPSINPAATPQAASTGIPPFLWDSMHPAVQAPTPAAQSFNTSQQPASDIAHPERMWTAPDIARPERIRTAPTRTESTEETSPREVKVTHEFKLTGKIEITGAHGIEDAAKKFAKSLEPMLEASFRKSLRSDYADKIIREKR